MKRFTWFAVGAVAALAGCANPTPSAGLTDVIERPAERALQTALHTGLSSPRDRASAYKLLAFIYCTSSRPADCEASFRAARQADPTFTLTRSEAGHPQWGPVYRRAVP